MKISTGSLILTSASTRNQILLLSFCLMKNSQNFKLKCGRGALRLQTSIKVSIRKTTKIQPAHLNSKM